MSSSPSRTVWTKSVDPNDPHPHGKPLSDAPVIRLGLSCPPEMWSSELPPHGPTINTADSSRLGRGTRLSCSPYTRPPHTRSDHTSSSFFATLEENLRGCTERIQVEVNNMSIAFKSTRTVVERVERERDNYRRQMELAERELSHARQERDFMREQFGALSLKAADESSPTSTTSGDELLQRLSCVGPERRNSFSKSSRLTSLVHGLPRSKSADPCIPSRGDECFDITSVAHPMPFRPGSTRKPEFIRDASRPHEPPRLEPQPYKPGEIDIQHIDILYARLEGRLFCRICHNAKKGMAGVTNFPNNSSTSWDDLRNHCMTEHPSECERIGKLKAAELDRFRRQLRVGR